MAPSLRGMCVMWMLLLLREPPPGRDHRCLARGASRRDAYEPAIGGAGVSKAGTSRMRRCTDGRNCPCRAALPLLGRPRGPLTISDAPVVVTPEPHHVCR